MSQAHSRTATLTRRATMKISKSYKLSEYLDWRSQAHSPSRFALTFVYPFSAAHRLRGIAANSSTTGTALPFFVRSIVLM